jgi:preprotein translocase subunit SecG
MAILINILLVIYVLVCALMILVILMQRPKSEGLGAAFGGGVTENIFGAQTTNVLTKFTGWLAGMFFLLTFVLSILYAHRGGASSELKRELMRDSPSAAMPVASPGAADAVPPPPAPVDGQMTATQPGQEPPQAAPANSPMPADLAVGAVRPVPPVNAPATDASPAGEPAASPAGTP